MLDIGEQEDDIYERWMIRDDDVAAFPSQTGKRFSVNVKVSNTQPLHQQEKSTKTRANRGSGSPSTHLGITRHERDDRKHRKPDY
ncbi:hypothetical protein [Candidatus Rariloculus sp.]|uniref:hypothetical protein n=1 Tax=Candidatus Rariloculus sp. TaxID=3101265 RepID=UPI003D0D8C96